VQGVSERTVSHGIHSLWPSVLLPTLFSVHQKLSFVWSGDMQSDVTLLGQPVMLVTRPFQELWGEACERFSSLTWQPQACSQSCTSSMQLQFCNLALRTEIAYDCKKPMQKLILRIRQASIKWRPFVEHCFWNRSKTKKSYNWGKLYNHDLSIYRNTTAQLCFLITVSTLTCNNALFSSVCKQQ